MWRNPNPKYRDQSQQPSAEPPAEQGQRLAAFPRRSGQFEQELRVNLAQYEGHFFVSLRLWQLDRASGVWWPLKGKGCSVRVAELDDLAEALERAARIVEDRRNQQPAGQTAAARRGDGEQLRGAPTMRGRSWSQAELPDGSAEQGFSEFD